MDQNLIHLTGYSAHPSIKSEFCIVVFDIRQAWIWSAHYTS